MQSDVAITVRVGVPSDHRSLVQIDEYAVSHFDRVAAIADALAAGECLVAESDQETLGYVVLNYTFFGYGFIPVIVVRPRIGDMASDFAYCPKRRLGAHRESYSRRRTLQTSQHRSCLFGLGLREVEPSRTWTKGILSSCTSRNVGRHDR